MLKHFTFGPPLLQGKSSFFNLRIFHHRTNAVITQQPLTF